MKRRKFWIRLFLILFGLLVLVRFLGVALVPTILDSLLEDYGYETEIEDISLSVFAGEARIRGVVIRPIEGEGAPILELQHGAVNLALGETLTGNPLLHRAEIDGLVVRLERLQKRGWNFESFLPEPSDEPVPLEEPEEDEDEPSSLDLSLPLRITALRAQDIHVFVRDEESDPDLQSELTVNVAAADLGYSGKTGTLEVIADATNLLDFMRMKAGVDFRDQSAVANLELEMRGAKTAPLKSLLSEFGVHTTGEILSAAGKLAANAEIPAEDNTTITAHLEMTDWRLEADSVESLALDSMSLDTSYSSTGSLAVDEFRVEGVRARTHQQTSGLLTVAGIGWIGLADDGESAPPAASPRQESSPANSTTTAPFLWSVDSTEILGGLLVHEDDLSETSFELRLDRLSLADLDSQLKREARLEVDASAPGLFESATVRGGNAPGENLTAQFDLKGCTLESLKPQLQRLGIRPRLGDASAHMELVASPGENGGGEFELRDLWFEEGEQRTALASIRATLLDFDDGVHLGEITLSGAQAKLERLENGDLSIGGFVLKTPPPQAAGPPMPAPARVAQSDATEDTEAESDLASTAPVPTQGGPRLQLDRFAWEDSRMEFVDHIEPSASFALANVAVELRDLAIGVEKESSVSAHLSFDGLCDEVVVEGAILSRPGLDLEAALDMDLVNLHRACLIPWMRLAGVAPAFETANAHSHLDLSLQGTAHGLAATLSLSEVSLATEERTLASMNEFLVEDLEVHDKGIGIGRVQIQKPEIRLVRDAGGVWSCGGIGLAGPAPEAKARPVEASVPVTAVMPVDPADQVEAPVAEEELPEFKLGAIELQDAGLWIEDALSEVNSEVRMSMSSSMTAFELGSRTPTEFESQVAMEGVPAKLNLKGALTPNPDAIQVSMEVSGSELDGRLANRYLPPQLQFGLLGADIGASVEAELTTRAAGGKSFVLRVQDAQLAEPDAEIPYAELELFELTAPRIEPEKDFCEIENILVRGLQLELSLEEDGAVQVAGIQLKMPKPSGADEVEASGEASESEEPGDLVVTEGSREVSWARRFDENPLPTVNLKTLDLELASLRFEDNTSEDSVPLVISGRVTHEEPLRLISPNPESLDPVLLQIQGQATPVVGDVQATMTLAPWEEEARFGLEVNVSEIRGEGITEVLPGLSSQLDGSRLQSGSFGGYFEGRLVGLRRNPVDFDFRNGFGFELSFNDLLFVEGEEKTVLAGLEIFDLDVERLNPETGEVRIANLELAGIQGQATMTEAGPSLLGLTVLLPEAEAEEVTPETEVPEETVAEAAPVEEPEVAPEPTVAGEAPAPLYDGPEIRLDRLTMSGLDFTITDERTTPPTVIPLNSLDFGLDRFTTRTFTEARPFRFAMYLGAGEVELPKPRKNRSALAGIAGAAMSVVSAKEDEFEYESRPVFGEISASGSLSLGPYPKGSVGTSVDGLELLTFARVAEQSGVRIGSGSLNVWSRAKLKGEKGIDVRSRLVFTDLSLDEPPGGPISTYLKLPAPLDTVLFAIKNNDNEHRIPMNFHLDADGLGAAQIAAVVTKTLAEVIASAVASAPLRVSDGVTEMLGLPTGGGSAGSALGRLINPVFVMLGLAEKPGPRSQPVTLEFEVGQYSVDGFGRQQLEPILEELRDRKDFVAIVEHTFGSQDRARAEELANPSPEECIHIAESLRRRKRALLKRRSELAADITASYAVDGATAAAAYVDELRELESELGQIELSLDETLALLRSGNERNSSRRTRAAMLQIGKSRLMALKEILEAAMKGDTTDRIEFRRPRLDSIVEDGNARVTVRLDMVPSR